MCSPSVSYSSHWSVYLPTQVEDGVPEVGSTQPNDLSGSEDKVSEEMTFDLSDSTPGTVTYEETPEGNINDMQFWSLLQDINTSIRKVCLTVFFFSVYIMKWWEIIFILKEASFVQFNSLIFQQNATSIHLSE